jgi:hypothetical protein
MKREIDDLKRQLQLAIEGKNNDPPGSSAQFEEIDLPLQIATSTAPQTLAETEIYGDILDDLYKK